MKLVTYQPLVRERFNESKSMKLLQEYLGFSPVFCFPANTAEEFLFGQFYASPSCPERLIGMDTDNYMMIDLVYWNRIMGRDDLSVHDIASCFSNVNPRYAEFIVSESEAENALYDENIDDIITDFIEMHQKNADTVQQPILHRLAEIDFYRKRNFRENLENIPEWTEQEQLLYKKDLLWETLGYALWKIIFEQPFLVPFDMVPVSPAIQKTMQGTSDVNEYHELQTMRENINQNPKKYLNYEQFDLFCKKFRTLLMHHAENVAGRQLDRNAPCPCGSGKKFRQCHGGNIKIRPEIA